MSEGNATLSVRIVDTQASLDELEGEWNTLAERTSASYFCSFEYVRTAWSHFHRPTDRLFVLVVSDGTMIVGIAPFYIGRERRLGIPCRVVKSIPMWEGDRPQVLAEGDVQSVWNRIVTFFANECRAWEVLDLVEQPQDGPAGQGWGFLARPGLRWERSVDAVGYAMALQGTWDDHLTRLSANTRSDWRRKSKRLREAHGDFEVECLSTPETMTAGLQRFITVERSGWKQEAGIGVARDDVHRNFYADLMGRLATRGAVSVYFLKVRGVDVAAIINFTHQGVVYMKHTAYAQSHSEFSPGVVLLAEVSRQLFGVGLREYDLLGMREGGAPVRYKAQWAQIRSETTAFRGYRVASRLLPWLAIRAAYKHLRMIPSAWRSRTRD